MVSRILFPVDYSEACAAAAPYVRDLAIRSGAALTVLHVMPTPDRRLLDWGAFLTLTNVRDLVLERRREFEAAYGAVFGNLSQVRFVWRHGDAAGQILSMAARRKADLIVMPTRGMGVPRRLLLGSVAAKVLHDTALPVLTLGENARTAQPGPFVCAVDFGDETPRIAAAANAFGAQFRRSVRFVHALDHSTGPATALSRLEALHGGLEPRVLTGPISEALTHQAAELFLIGRGRSVKPLGRLRSNAYAIIRDSNRPVLSV